MQYILKAYGQQSLIKATHLKIMFASTSNIGTIEDETMKIITTNDAPSASSIGSELWIDNLTFSY